MHDGERKKGEAVWAIGADECMPVNGEPAGQSALLRLNRHFEKRLKEFILAIGKVREAAT